MALPLRDDHRTRHLPWMTLLLIGVNVFVFLFLQPSGFQVAADEDSAFQDAHWSIQETEEYSYRWGAVACELTTGETVADDPDGCEGERGEFLPQEKSIPLALLTCMFLHGSILHLAGNMLFLWVFGNNVEDRLGPGLYLALYLIGGMVATVGFVAANSTSAVPLIGASGAIAVAMGAYLVFFPRARILTVIATASFQVVYVPAAVVLILYFVTQFFTGDDAVAWEAHAAGMAAGIAGALVLARAPAIRRRSSEDAGDLELRGGAAF